MKPRSVPTRLAIVFFLIFFNLLFLPGLSFGVESLCAEVKIEISQELTLERQAFDAHMRINNGLANLSLDHVAIVVNFTDEDGNPVAASFDPNADPETTRFWISVDSMDNITDINGQGSVAPSTSADIHWLIIPVPGAAEGQPKGKLYYVGATLTYDIGGEENVTEVTPDYIYVKPLPDLALDYFIPSEVYGDDAFTSETEPPVPFSLGVRVKNTGAGTARNLKIDSAQPRITENEQGLLIGFNIEGTEVNGKPRSNSLLVAFGDVLSGGSASARWIMTCTLSGEFVSFGASISHSDELGGELTSLIKQENVNTHFLIRDVIADDAGSDAIKDFLAKYGTGVKLFESTGEDSDVDDVSSSASLALTGSFGTELHYTLSVPPSSGFVFLKLPDPQNGSQVIKSVIRSDGKRIKDENAWLSKSRKANPADGWNHYINLFDVDSPASYTMVYDDPGNVPLPPVIDFIENRTGVENQNISFVVQATDPNGTTPALSAQSLPVGAAFTDRGDGTGLFGWTPSIGQAGSYSLAFIASDGALEDVKRAVLTIYPYDDTDGDGMNDDWEMDHFGTLDRDGTGDFDGDGISDLLEFQLGTDPTKDERPPTIPMIQSPMEDEVTNLSPALTIENSTDPDGDTLTYEFEVFTDATLTEQVAASGSVPEGTQTTSWTVPVTLDDNTAYVWRVRAFDGVAYSLWAYATFFVNTANNAPSAPRVSYPPDNTHTSTVTSMLQVTAATDVDADVLTYAFAVYSDSNLTSLIASASGIPEIDGVVNWTIDQILTDNTDYYWQVTVTDVHGAQAASTPAMFHVNTANAAPTTPVITSPQNGSTQGTAPVITVTNASDGDGDTLTYVFEIDTAPTFDSPAKQVSGSIPEGEGATSWQPEQLSDNTIYYIRVKASDGTADSPWTVGGFNVNTVNDAPASLEMKNPGLGTWVTTLTPTLAAADISNADQDVLTWHFEIYGDTELTDRVLEGQSSTPEWTVSEDLQNNTRYFWRAQAEDDGGLTGDWTGAGVFFVKQSTTPNTLDVNLSTSLGQPLANVRIYAFTEAGAYTGTYVLTDDTGTARFNPADFQEGSYKFRADYMNRQFWSTVVALPGTYTVPMVIFVEPVTVTIRTAAGPAENINVYVFTDTGAYLNLKATTDANGRVTFVLPAGYSYKFRADIMGNQYWSGDSPVQGGSGNDFTVDAGGGQFAITVQEAEGIPMQDLRVYLFHDSGAYMNVNRLTDAQGQAAFNVPQGTYKVRADYRGYKFWSADTTITTNTDIDLTIPHQDVTITVNSTFDQAIDPLVSVKAYLFTEAGAYMNLNATTDAGGQVTFHLPEAAYKVRADYLGRQFWSDPFTWQDMNINIAMADAAVSVGWGSSYLEGVPVYAFLSTGGYLNLNQTTGSDGKVQFRLPAAGMYKFRADYQASQFWTEDTTLAADQVTPVEITTGGGSFTFTVLKGVNDPLMGAMCYVFSESGAFFGVYGPTSSEGKVTFDLAQGTYNIRANYLGYQFWSPLYDVPVTLDETFTIPHQDVTIAVNGVYDGTPTPLESIPVYLFTQGGAYQNLNASTNANGQVVFNLPPEAYKVRADYMNQQFWSDDFTQTDTQVDIPMADAVVSVTGGGQLLSNIPVYVFTAEGAYLNLTRTTDAIGQVTFRLPAGAYTFRANYQGSEYWTDQEVLLAGESNPIEISTGGGSFEFTVLKGADNPLVGATCYVFSDTGSYLNMNAVTSSEGQVSFDLANGDYKIRVDYLGYQFWSNVYSVPATLSETLTLPHQDVTITVNGLFQSSVEPLEGIPVYLYTESGVYMNQNPSTNTSGQVTFSLPSEAYKVRADYRNQQFWSGPFTQTDTTVAVPMAEAQITVIGAGQPLAGVRVYAYTGAGTYLNLNEFTDAGGQVNLRLPAGDYKFRADYQSSQYWTDATSLAADVVNPVMIDTGGGAFTLTVMKNGVDTLEGFPCYVFSESGTYLGLSGTLDGNGQVTFNLANGSYKFRVNYLGYQFWTNVYIVPTTLEDTFLIPHQNITVTVEGLYQTTEPLENVKVYLFTGAGSYQNKNLTTDVNGQVGFSLPDVQYKVRVDYLGYQFWSDVFQSTDTTVTIDRGLAKIHVHRSGANVENARVYLYTGAGAYMNQNQYTDAGGTVQFLIPAKSYKFRADEGGDQVYSDALDIIAGQENNVEIDLE